MMASIFFAFSEENAESGLIAGHTVPPFVQDNQEPEFQNLGEPEAQTRQQKKKRHKQIRTKLKTKPTNPALLLFLEIKLTGMVPFIYHYISIYIQYVLSPLTKANRLYRN